MAEKLFDSGSLIGPLKSVSHFVNEDLAMEKPSRNRQRVIGDSFLQQKYKIIIRKI
jgi:hypothetical protein